MVCPDCGSLAPESAKFCSECGFRLLVPCPACGALVACSHSTCAACGTALEPTHAARPLGERRRLTVMYCDVVESVSLGEELDAEDVHAVLCEFQETCSRILRRFDATIERHVGDALLVYFGYPRAHENDAERAIGAGLEIAAAVARQRFGRDRGLDLALAVRVGIDTGLVVVGEIGGAAPGDRQVLGQTMNLAARLQSIAPPNGVLATAETLRLAAGMFVTQSLGPRQLKGFRDAVTAFHVLGVTGARARLDVVPASSLTPLVGREAESAELLAHWRRIPREGGRAVLVRGEAGVGKSRLARTLRDKLGAEPHTWLECGCSPLASNTAFHPILQLVAKESAAIPVPTAKETPEQTRRRTIESVLDWVLRTASTRPTVLLIEDLHWSDPSTLEVVGMLIDRIAEAGLLCLLTHRPEFVAPWLASRVFDLDVARLDLDHTIRLAANVAGTAQLPDRVHRIIAEKADGIPLYAEELAKAATEDWAIRDPRSSGNSVPATLHDSLMARLDRLGNAKRIAQLAAAVGREFRPDVLGALVDEPAEVQASLDRLVAARILYRHHGRGGPTYVFNHALTQEAAHASILKRERATIHRRIVEALESLPPGANDRRPEILAHHLVEAREPVRAALAYDHAGRSAAAAAAHEEAIAHYRNGLEAIRDAPDGAQRNARLLSLHLMLANAMFAAQGFGSPAALDVWQEAERIAVAVDDPLELSSILNGLATYYLSISEFATAERYAERILALGENPELRPARLRGHCTMANILFYRGNPTRALEHANRALASYEPGDFERVTYGSVYDQAVVAYGMAALSSWWCGSFDRALTIARTGYDHAVTLNSSLSLAMAQGFVAFVHYFRREMPTLATAAARLAEIARELRFPGWQAFALVLTGAATCAVTGDVAGVRTIEEGFSRFGETNEQANVTFGLGLLAEAQWNVGLRDEALSTVSQAYDLVAALDQRYYEAELLRLRGDFLTESSRGAADEAEVLYRRALDVARSQGSLAFELRSVRSLAQLLERTARTAEAATLLGGSIARFEEGFETSDLQDARAVLDRCVARNSISGLGGTQ